VVICGYYVCMAIPYNPRKALAVLNLLQAEGVPFFMTPTQAAKVCEYYEVENATFKHSRKNKKDVTIVSVARYLSQRLEM